MYEKLRSSYIIPISLYPRTFLEYKAEYPRTCSGIQTLVALNNLEVKDEDLFIFINPFIN